MAKEPASIRYKNPGAMWGSPRATKWGATTTIALNDGTGQNNTIANFPTFVQGAAAQFDLWRAVYAGLTLTAAIKKWSGGNSSARYMDFLVKQTGIGAGVVITNDILAGPRGIKLMKAQAQWEAGKPYPMGDDEWKRAQDMVFRGAVGPVKKNVRMPSATVDENVEAAQNQLKTFGYYEVGDVDGLWGGRTVGALTAFLTDYGSTFRINANDRTVRPEIQEVLSAAARRGFVRPIAPQRAEKVAKDLAPVNEAVHQSLLQRTGANVTGWASGVGAVVAGATQMFPSVSEQIAPVRSFFTSVPGWVWFALVAGIALITYLSAKRTTDAVVTDYNSGKIN